MTATLALLVLLAAGPEGWQSYTNTNFINDLTGRDSVLYEATNGGVVKVKATASPATETTLTNTEGLPVNRCRCIVQDTAGNLWVGTEGGGLAVIEAESLRATVYRPADMALRIRALAWDGARLLAGTDQGLYVVDTKGTLLDFGDDDIRRFTWATEPRLRSDQVMSISVLDRYWIGTNRGLTSANKDFTRWDSFPRFLGDSVRATAWWHDSIAVGTERGIALFFPDTLPDRGTWRQVFRFRTPTAVYDLVAAGARLYCATAAGLYEGDAPDSARFQLVLGEDTRAVSVGDILWVGCGGWEQSGSGLRYQVSGQSWAGFYNTCIVSDDVADCAISPNGDKFLCHGGGWLTRIGASGEVSAFLDPAPIPIQVRVDSRGRPWFAHFAGDGGLSAYDPAAGTWERVQWGAASAWNIIDALGIGRDDTKWVFNGGAVIVAVDSTGAQAIFEIAGLSAPPGGGYEFAFDSKGRAWLGLTSGLVMIDYGGTLLDKSDDEYRVINSGLPSPEVRSVSADAQDRVWVATAQGAAVWDGEEFKVFTTASTGGGLPSNNVYRVRVDASDRVWMLCDAGLAVYDPVTSQWENYSGGLITNTQGLVGFYSSLDVSSIAGTVAVGTKRGVSVRGFSTPAPKTAQHLRVYPNPCVLGAGNQDKRVVIDSLPDEILLVRVYTLDGRPVAELKVDRAMHRAVWDPSGKASGLYLLMVIGPSGTRVERVAVIRP